MINGRMRERVINERMREIVVNERMRVINGRMRKSVKWENERYSD